MRTLMFKVIAAGVLLACFGLGWLWMDYNSYLESPLKVGEQGLRYELKHGTSLTRAIYELAQQGVIERPRYLLWHARFSGNTHQIKAGEYDIAANTTARAFMEQLFQGKVMQYALTLVEGWSFKQMMEAVNREPNLEHTLAGLDAEAIMQTLGYTGQHPEGRFLPDTYHFPKGMNDVAFLLRAYHAMEKRLTMEWERRDLGLPFKSPYEALIMASIVEKETGQPSERQAIAGVFIRRLQKRMRLQTDPTVIYGMGDRYKGNIRRQDLLRDTPYNTYRRYGLPPTPIAMPGRDAIHATLHPDDSDNLYFVSRGDGSHHFSATLDEHNRAVIKYQLKGRKRPFSSYKAE